MTFTKNTLLSLTDKLLFQVIPGICFWFYLWTIFIDISETLRLSGSVFTLPFYLVALLYIFGFVYWIFLGDTALAPTPPSENKSISQKFFPHLFILSANIFIIIFFFPPQTYSEFFIKTGGLHFLGIFAGDMIFALYQEFYSFLKNIKHKEHNKLKNNVFLLLLIVVIYIIPTLYSSILFFQKYSSGSIIFFLPILLNFNMILGERFLGHKQNFKPNTR